MKRHIVWFLALVLVGTGCLTKAKSNARARAAFVAGRQQALATQLQGPMVQVVGDVKTHVIPWTEELTLLDALIAAEYQGFSDPSQIVVVHNGEANFITPQALFRGENIPLEAGDRIEIRP